MHNFFLNLKLQLGIHYNNFTEVNLDKFSEFLVAYAPTRTPPKGEACMSQGTHASHMQTFSGE